MHAFAQEEVVAEVNGRKITQSDLELEYLIRQVPDDQRTVSRDKVLNALVEAELMRGYLREHRIKVNQIRLKSAVENLYQLIRKADRKPDELLNEIGISETTMKQQLELPLMWQIYLEKIVTPDRLRSYYKKYRNQFDGTELRLSQIFLPVSSEENAKQQLEELSRIRQSIKSGQLKFADAAGKYSQAPTASKGGDMGFTPYAGKTPTQITQHVFGLNTGEMSEPFLSPFGAHLVLVTEVKPGDLSLEDVRPQVWNRVRHELWERQVTKLKSTARIKVD